MAPDSQTPQTGSRECEGLNRCGVWAGDGQDQGQKVCTGPPVLNKESSGLGHGRGFQNLLSASSVWLGKGPSRSTPPIAPGTASSSLSLPSSAEGVVPRPHLRGHNVLEGFRQVPEVREAVAAPASLYRVPQALKPEPACQCAYLTHPPWWKRTMKMQLPVPFPSASAAACLWKTGAG